MFVSSFHQRIMIPPAGSQPQLQVVKTGNPDLVFNQGIGSQQAKYTSREAGGLFVSLMVCLTLCAHRYVYLFPLQEVPPAPSRTNTDGNSQGCASSEAQPLPCMDVDVQLVNTMLQGLEGRELNYSSFARDTPKGESIVSELAPAVRQ